MGGRNFVAAVTFIFCLFAVTACSGDGGVGGASDIGETPTPPTRQKPTAAFAVTPTAGIENTNFKFDATPSYDLQDSTAELLVRWDFENDGAWDTNFTTTKKIERAYTTVGSHTVRLQVEDTDGNLDSTTHTIEVIPGNSPSVSGTILFEKVPITPSGLDFDNIVNKPARRIQVQAVRSSDGTTVGETTTDDTGSYSVQAPANTTLYIRAVAKMNNDGYFPVEVTPPDSSNVYSAKGGDIDLGTTDITGKNYLIPDSSRASGPFNILDIILQAYDMVHAANPQDTLPELKVRWSPSNANGTYYWLNAQGENQLFILGQRDVDSDEFDDHVVAHEFGHFIARSLYRDDSIGGDHALGDKLDVRVAYSEGFASAFGGMALADPLYLDSYGTNGSSIRVSFDMEDNGESGGGNLNPGYWSEASMYAVCWDLYDTASDSFNSKTDNLAYGFGPLNSAWSDSTINTNADLMYIYPFAHTLKNQNPGDATAIDDILAMENITETYPDESETITDVTLPYNAIGVSIDGTFGYNKYAANHFYRFTLTSTSNIRVRTTTNPSTNDVDIILMQKGAWLDTAQTSSGNETLERWNLPAGTYVVNIMAYTRTDYNITIETF